MTHEEADDIDDRIAAAISVVCQRSGSENDYPPPRFVREAFKAAGLAIVLVVPTSD